MFDSATQILASIRKGDLSSVEVLTEHLNHIEQINPKINAVVQMDMERAMARAKAVDEAYCKKRILVTTPWLTHDGKRCFCWI